MKRRPQPIELYVPDGDDEEVVSYAVQVVAMLANHGYDVGALFVADQDR